MIDDSLSDVQQPKGGYCSKCNTVWCEPGKCRCEDLKAKVNPKYCGACDSFRDDDGICECVGTYLKKCQKRNGKMKEKINKLYKPKELEAAIEILQLHLSEPISRWIIISLHKKGWRLVKCDD